MVRAPFDHFCYVFGLLVYGHSSDDRPGRRRRGDLNLDWTGLRNLTVEFLQQRGILGIGNKIHELIKNKTQANQARPVDFFYRAISPAQFFFSFFMTDADQS